MWPKYDTGLPYTANVAALYEVMSEKLRGILRGTKERVLLGNVTFWWADIPLPQGDALAHDLPFAEWDIFAVEDAVRTYLKTV